MRNITDSKQNVADNIKRKFSRLCHVNSKVTRSLLKSKFQLKLPMKYRQELKSAVDGD